MAIVAPIDGSPADKAGLLPGDVITAIDGKPVAGQELDAARSQVRGPKDTAVTLTIVRDGGAPRDVEIVRGDRDPAGGRSRGTSPADTVGYLKLSGFSDHAARPAGRGRRPGRDRRRSGRSILDLRGNPGGFVTAARDIASEFLADGTVFWQRDAEGNLTETVAKPGGKATDPSIQLVVLVDGGSASASEIVAAALHDRGRATLVGTKTFGKGTVQQWTQLEDDSGGFRLTTARWLTPGPDVDPRQGDRAGRRRDPRRPRGPATTRSSTPGSPRSGSRRRASCASGGVRDGRDDADACVPGRRSGRVEMNERR